MMKKWVGWVAAIGLLSACQTTELGGDGQITAPGVDVSKQDLDPMLVGHRLMAAKQYELALKSFYRAAGQQGLTAPVLASLGTANLGLGRLGQAEDLLRQSVKIDETYVPAWNNLGVVLMQTRKWGEASRVLETAFALDSGESAEIQQNLTLALANLDQPVYSEPQEEPFKLVYRGTGDYLLMSTK